MERYLVSEEYVEAEGYYGHYGLGGADYTVREWTFTYSDGEVEVVTARRACK